MTAGSIQNITEDYVRSFRLIDADLELVFIEIHPTSPPDESINTISFKTELRSNKTQLGELNLRLGYSDNIRLYRGNIGFTIFEPFRGNRYASRGSLLLIPLLLKLRFSPV